MEMVEWYGAKFPPVGLYAKVSIC